MTEIRRHNGPALMTLIAIFIVIKTNVSTDPFILTSRIGEPGTTGSKVAIPAYGQPISLRRRSIAADLSSVSSFRGGMRGSGNHWGEKEAWDSDDDDVSKVGHSSEEGKEDNKIAKPALDDLPVGLQDRIQKSLEESRREAKERAEYQSILENTTQQLTNFTIDPAFEKLKKTSATRDHFNDTWEEIPIPKPPPNATQGRRIQEIFGMEGTAEKDLERARKGELEYMFQMAKRCAYGWDVRLDPSKAIQWATKAADEGLLDSMILLGDWYFNGTGPVPKDIPTSIHWYEKAAEKGDKSCMYKLGVIITSFPTQYDIEKAAYWWRRATQLGHPLATYNYASLLAEGVGVGKNLELAAKLFEVAADPGGIASAGHNLGMLYIDGEGVTQDLKKAKRWLEWAAGRGLTESMCQLGTMYSQEIGVKKDWEKALMYFRNASHLGDAQALTNIGLCYLYGDGVPQNEEKAFDCFYKAAAKNNIQACFHLALLKKDGRGCKKDYAVAMDYMERATKEEPEAMKILSLWILEKKPKIGTPAMKKAVKLMEDAAMRALTLT
ncbi:hypothetical protein AAMO2058_001096600 [Amorphochlora amoebiformis]